MSSIPALLTSLLLASLFAAGCDRNTEPFVEGEEPRPPDLARIFPGSSSESGPESASGQAAPPRAAARPDPAAAQPDPAAAQPDPVAAQQPASAAGGGTQPAGENIRGTVVLAPELADGLPTAGSLFVIARLAGVTAGPPLAVLRISGPRFPVSFEIGPQNVMIPSMRFDGEIQITARFDADGDAMTQLPGDLSGAASAPHVPGASGVNIVLDTRI